jgi:uncharacterized protein (TIGR02391 family)
METRISVDRLLHPRIASHCLQLYLDGHFKHAAGEAMTQVELALKERAGFNCLYGVRLVNALFGDGKCIKLFVPFGDELQKHAHDLFKAAFSYYRNYTAHDGSLINEQEAMRIIILATELLELIGASNKSFSDIGGVDGLVKYGVFINEKHLCDILKFLTHYILPEDAPDGFFEDLAQQGYSQEHVDAVIETGLIEYESNEMYIPEPFRVFKSDSTEMIGTFNLTDVGNKVLRQLSGLDPDGSLIF